MNANITRFKPNPPLFLLNRLIMHTAAAHMDVRTDLGNGHHASAHVKRDVMMLQLAHFYEN